MDGFVRALVLTGFAAAVAMPGLAAQEGRSIFAAVDDGDRVVSVGAALSGSLSSTDLLITGGRRVQIWSLAADPGSELQVDMRSDDFDTYLYVVGPGLGSGLQNDDGGDGLNSRICFEVAEAAEYRIVASALGSDVGDFTLSVAETGGCGGGSSAAGVDVDIETLPTEGRSLAMGATASGRLSASDPTSFGSPVQAWAMEGTAGGSFSVDLVSEDFDAYLTVLGPGLESWLSDDDGAGRCDSRVTGTFPASGSYRVIVSTLGSGFGSFDLSLSESPSPANPESCLPPSDTGGERGAYDDVPEAGSLEVDGFVMGVMVAGDVMVSGRAVQLWTLDAGAGDRLSIDLVSSDFDAYVHFDGPGFPTVLTNDDGGEGLNSRLCVQVPETGTYRVFAGPLSGAGIGDEFRLSARRAGAEEFCDGFELAPAAIADAIASLDTEGRVLEVGGQADGTLAAGDITHPESGRRVQPWSLDLPAGQRVAIDVVSYAFDPVLYIAGGGLGEMLYNDDGDGPGCQSRLYVELEQPGTVTLLPGALYDGGAGGFLIRASADPPALEDGGCVSATETAAVAGADAGALEGLATGGARPLEIGEEVRGALGGADERLPDGSFGQVWTFRGEAGESIAIGLSSDDFDTTLYLQGPGLATPLFDDDGGGGTDSRIETTLPESGEYSIVASSYSEGAAGPFRLYVVRIR